MSRRFGLVGYPLGHTMSPPIHKILFELSNRKDDSYRPYEIAPENLFTHITKLKQLDGFNVTIPHKIAIIEYLNELSEGAKRYGAVNVVKNINSKHIGYNTDVDGFIRSLNNLCGDLTQHETVLYGCGGAGRMMAIEMALISPALLLVVRREDIPLAAQTTREILAIKPDARVRISTPEDCDGIPIGCKYLLINATPVGMYPNVDECIISDKRIQGATAVFDAVYNPTETLLIKKARKYGAKTCGGMEMLVWQAVVAHEIWDNATYTQEQVNDIITQMEKLV